MRKCLAADPLRKQLMIDCRDRLKGRATTEIAALFKSLRSRRENQAYVFGTKRLRPKDQKQEERLTAVSKSRSKKLTVKLADNGERVSRLSNGRAIRVPTVLLE